MIESMFDGVQIAVKMFEGSKYIEKVRVKSGNEKLLKDYEKKYG